MKAQKLGLVLGMNMAVACLVFQGCKASRPGAGTVSQPTVDATTTVENTPVVESRSVASAPQVSTIDVTPVAVPAPVEQPTQVAVVKPLPTVQKQPEASAVAEAQAPAAGDGSSSVVVVQRGDTLSGICVRNRVKMSAVIAANPGLIPNHILAGQRIVLPAGAVAAVAAVPAKPSKVMQASAPVAANTTAPVKTKSAFKPYNGPTKEYKVRSGDTLGKLAYESGITIRALKEMNKLAKDVLRVGQVIQIPAEKVLAPAVKPTDAAKPVEKAVKEPVAKKAAEPKAAASQPSAAKTVPAAKEAAPASTETAAPVVEAPAPAVEATAPAVEAAAPAAAVAPESAPAVEATPASSMTYTVKEGDDIVGVAIAWGISPSQLMDLNNLKAGEAISAGQVLKLPANAKQNGQ